ncbi:MAG: hypothetical protein KDC98_26035, partial [Planctomycetes bacterium]|nr:hypothetical protein [Planctomycetota bacterium]
TVAVFYDRSLEEADGFSKEDLANAVKAMVGWDKERDAVDSFSVLPGDFPAVDVEALMSSGPGMLELALQWGPTVGQVLGVIVVVLFLRGLFKRTSRQPAGVAGAAGAGAEAEEKPPSPDELQRRMRREIERAIASDPAALAKLLETWLIEQGA